MRKVFAIILAAALTLAAALPVFATEGNVIYDGRARECIFTPGSEYSPTDLFPNFKDVMPGDTIEQTIVVKNDARNNVRIKIYMRALGGHPESEEFLSRLALRVESPEGEIMFDAASDETAQLTEWRCLGTLSSGGEVELKVILDVPTSLDNMFKDYIGYLDWEFAIEEFPTEPDDPVPPTGDESGLGLYILLAVLAAAALTGVAFATRKKH